MYDIVNKWRSNTHTNSTLRGIVKDIKQYTYFPGHLSVGLNVQLELITVLTDTIGKAPYYILVYNTTLICIYYSCIYTYMQSTGPSKCIFQYDTQKKLYEYSNLLITNIKNVLFLY